MRRDRIWEWPQPAMVSIFDPEKVCSAADVRSDGRFLEQIRDEAKSEAAHCDRKDRDRLVELDRRQGCTGAARMALKALANGGVKNVQ